jgi:SOS-response transcriptional repressor LexA
MNEPPAAHRPSKKQRELLTFIEGFITQHGYGPSYREIMRALNYKSVSTVAVHIDNLIKKGHLLKRNKSARSLEICSVEVKTTPAAVKSATKLQEKWLIDTIAAKFAAAEKEAASLAELDSLYVLVGALHVLGLPEAARSYQGRLQALKQQKAK